MKITVSAPGKLMLLGEHAVVYGKPCLVTAVGQRMKATVEITTTTDFDLNAPDVGVENYKKPMSQLGVGDIPKACKFVEIAIKNFVEIYPITGGVKVATNSEFSSLFGFGSSSASTVCIIKALSELTGKKLSEKEIFDLSYKTVLDIQSKGSGFDIAAAIYGGTLHFITGGKLIEPLNVPKISLIIGYTGVKANSVTLINQVADLADKYPEIVDDIYDQILLLVEVAKVALEKGDFKTAGEVMNLNQGFLETLGVSSSRLSSLIYAVRDAGAYGAKLSGAGGGDCMVALASPEKTKAVKEAITKAGGEVIEVETGVEGVRIEK